MPRTCGACFNHDAAGQLCTLGLSYAAFVRADAPANGCIGFIDRERAVAEQAQSECRGGAVYAATTIGNAYQMWRDAMKGSKP